jgi:hypothetical protein
VLARLGVHQQVEVPLPIARLGVGEAVERVRQRAAILREQLDLVGREARLATPALRRVAGDADDVAEVEVELAGTARVGQHLDAPRAVDDVEEDELAVPAARHHAPGDPDRLTGLDAGVERLGGRAHGSDLGAVGEPLRQPVHGGRV